MSHYQKTKYPGICKSEKSIQISFNLENGERRREVKKLCPTNANLRWADNFRGAILIAIEKGTFCYSDYFPRSKYLKRSDTRKRVFIRNMIWKNEVQNPDNRLRIITMEKARAGMRSIETHLGDILISELTRADIKLYVKKMRDQKGASTITIKKYLVPLRKVIVWGLDQNLVDKDPFQGFVIKKTLEEEEEAALNQIDPFDVDEVERIIGKATGQLKNMVQFCFWTGLRLCELFALGWENIDFANGEATVEIDIVNGRYGLTKTNRARTITLNKDALQALQNQREHTYMKPAIKLRLGKKERELRPIFYDSRFDRPFTKTQELQRIWPNLLRRAKVRLRPAKNMRHSYASMSLSSGEDEKWVANQLGHTTTEMLQRTYGKWLDGAAERVGRKGGDRINDLIASRKKPPA